MSKFHINKHGDAALCSATTMPCPLGGEHFDTAKDAATASMRAEMGLDPSTPAYADPDTFIMDNELPIELALEFVKEDYNAFFESLTKYPERWKEFSEYLHNTFIDRRPDIGFGDTPITIDGAPVPDEEWTKYTEERNATIRFNVYNEPAFTPEAMLVLNRAYAQRTGGRNLLKDFEETQSVAGSTFADAAWEKNLPVCSDCGDDMYDLNRQLSPKHMSLEDGSTICERDGEAHRAQGHTFNGFSWRMPSNAPPREL